MRESRVHLAQLPTPIESLEKMSAYLGGSKILIKRDDQTGLALGGNKTRKLEFLIADALEKKADVVLTAGAAQSNHCRQTAAAATKVGLRCILVLGGKAPEVPNGNLLLDAMLGAEIHWTGTEQRLERMGEIAGQLRKEGHVPYVIPYGGSNGVGAQGYVVAVQEALAQLTQLGEHVGTMVIASSSGGTQAGMALGAKLAGYDGRIIGISIDKGERGPERFEVELADIANATAEAMGSPVRMVPEEFLVEYGYLGGGYGVVGPLEREALSLMATLEGIILDPVYTGRAFGALIDMIRKGRLHPGGAGKSVEGRSSVLFWHTGGAVACFAYAKDLL
jgi:D-cysteine desulfhydrase family pyridoxal phosphate-dependent enzyme